MSHENSEKWQPPFYKQKKNPPVKRHKKFFSNSVVCKRRKFIRLFCPHCHTHCVTFTDYKKHLFTDKHDRALKRRLLCVEKQVDSKRQEQKDAQEKADEADRLLGISTTVVKYCVICDLNFYQEESKHVASKLHIVLQKMVQPICKICMYKSTSPEDYETHLCSLEHLKSEEGWLDGDNEMEGEQLSSKEDVTQPPESTSKDPKSTSKEPESTSEDPKSTSKDPESTSKDPESTSKDPKSTSKDPESTSKDPEEGPNVIQKVEALFCSVCKQYLPHDDNQESVIKTHCATDDHLRNWAKYVEEKHQQAQSSENM